MARITQGGGTGAGSRTGTRPVGQGELILNALDYGAKGDGTTDDTAALQAWLNDVAALGREGYLPSGTYITSAGLTCTQSSGSRKGIWLRGDGRAWTEIRCSLVGGTVLTVGGAANGGQGGHCFGITFTGATAAPSGSDYSTGLLVTGLRQFTTESCHTQSVRIGFDLQQNCYGSTFINCTSGAVMPAYVRGSATPEVNAGAGNDIQFYHCRFKGTDGAIAIGNGAAGIRVIGGLMAGGPLVQGTGSPDNSRGAINTCFTYEMGDTSTGGGSSVYLFGVSFEQTENMYGVRVSASCTLTAIGCQLNANVGNGGIAPFGFVNSPSAAVSMIGCEVKGTWTSSSAWEAIGGVQSAFSINEVGTYVFNTATFAGTAAGFLKSMRDLASTSLQNKATSLGNTPKFGAEVTSPDFAPLGLTGATAVTRYVGGTSTGAPTSGTFQVGDWVITRDGNIFVCTVAGSPGTWNNPANIGAIQTYPNATKAISARVTGVYYSGSLVTNVRTLAPTLGTFYGALCYSADGLTIDSLQATVTAAGTGGLQRLGIYTSTSSSSGMAGPWTLAVDAGTVDCSTTGLKTLTLGTPVVVGADQWFLVGGAQQGTAAATMQVGGSNNAFSPLGGTYSSQRQIARIITGVTGALPSTIPVNAALAATDAGVEYRRSA